MNISDTIVNDHAKNLNEQLKAVTGLQWKQVQLPHTAFPEPLVIVKPREGIAWYKKTFRLVKKEQHKSISLYFGAAMQVADIWVNNTYVTRHTGGYLPFVIDISHMVNFDKENTIYLKLNNKANPVVPPGAGRKAGLYYQGFTAMYGWI